MILVSLKDGKKVTLESKNPPQKEPEMIEFENSSSFNSEDDDDASSSVAPKQKRQRLTHLSYEEKLQRRKLKNRIAAQSARDRKKNKFDSLEENVRQLREENEQLRTENQLLKEKTQLLIEENRKLLEFKKVSLLSLKTSTDSPNTQASVTLTKLDEVDDKSSKRKLREYGQNEVESAEETISIKHNSKVNMRFDSLYNESNKPSGTRSKNSVSRREISQHQVRSIAPIRPKINKIENSSSQTGQVAEKNAAGSIYSTATSINTESNNPIGEADRYGQPEQMSNIAYNVPNDENEKRASVKNVSLAGQRDELQSLFVELQDEYNESSSNKPLSVHGNINNNSGSINLLDGISTKADNINNLNEILNELYDLTKEITSDQEMSNHENELKREQSQINWFLNQNDQAQIFENFDIDLFDNVLVYNNDPMIDEIKL